HYNPVPCACAAVVLAEFACPSIVSPPSPPTSLPPYTTLFRSSTVPASPGPQRKKVTVPVGVGPVPVTYAVSWTSVPVGGAPPQLECVVTVGVSCTRKKQSALLSVWEAGR